MPPRKKQSTETLKGITIRVVNSLKGPTPADEIVQKILSIRSETGKKLNSTIRTYLKHEIGQTLVYLDKQTIVPIALAFQGVRFRINLDEIHEKGYLFYREFEPFLAELNPDTVQFVSKDGTSLKTDHIKVENKRKQSYTWQQTEYFSLIECFPQQKIQVGDSILVSIVQYQPQPIFCLEYETASQRQEKKIHKKNQELANILFGLLENAYDEYIMIREAIPTAYCRLQNPRDYPGDNWKKVLKTDNRLCYMDWRIVYPEAQTFRDIFMDKPESEKEMEIKQKQAKLSPEKAKRIYCWKVSFSYNPDIWRRLELQGLNTLAEFDHCLREAFQYDLDDHLGGFWRMIQRGKTNRFREIQIADIEPSGEGQGAELRIADLDLQEGNLLKYVYDFGAWLEHTIILESVSQPSTQAKYPRLIDRNKPRYRYCEDCQQKKSKTIATWVCIECSNEEQRIVLVCEDCLNKYHQDHSIDRILY